MFKAERLKLVGLVGLVLGLGGITLAGCQPRATTTSHRLTVVTTTNFYGEVAQAVGGKHVKVTSIINRPSVDPHDYEPTTNVAKTVSHADFALANGIGYDGWMNKVVKSTGHAKLISVGEDVLGRRNGANEHLWYDVATMPKVAQYLAKQFGQRDPRHRTSYQKNAQRYVESLKPINHEVTKLKAAAQKMPTRQVLVSEPVFDDALTTLGFKVANVNFENAVEKGTDPSPRVIKQMQTDLKRKRVAFFVDNRQVSDKLVENMVTVAQRAGVPVLKVTETMPAHVTYQQWMLNQYRQLEKILKASAKVR